jgi:hypothetical protein
LDTKFYTEHFQYFEPTKKRYAGTIPRSMPFILKSGERTMLNPDSVAKVYY